MHDEHKGTILLAKTEGLGEVSLCGCGVISLHLGSVTLRLESRALLQVESLLQEAIQSLCELSAQPHPRIGANPQVH